MKKGRGRPKVVLVEVVKNGYVNWGSNKEYGFGYNRMAGGKKTCDRPWLIVEDSWLTPKIWD